MNLSAQITLALAKKEVMEAVTENQSAAKGMAKRLRAVWVDPADTQRDLGTLAGFSGGTSFSGTNGSLTLAWPEEKNPRTSGSWQQVLVPDDRVRIKIFLVVQTTLGKTEVPLLTGIPSPDGINELYSRKREIVEIKIEDVTGAALRNVNYSLPYIEGDTVDAKLLTGTILGSVPFICLYETKPVDACVNRFPNALMAADDALIKQQDVLNPLTGQKRIRYGDRDGRIIYRIVQEPVTGEPFTPDFPSGDYGFELDEKRLLRNFRVEPEYIRFTCTRVNPYIDLAGRVKLSFTRAGLGEIVEIHEAGWKFMPHEETFSLKGRRQQTL